MLVCISPAKKLDWKPVDAALSSTSAFEKQTLSLAKTARNLSMADLRALMKLSPDLARLNKDRFDAFSSDPASDHCRPAAFAFAGDTYQGLEFATLDTDAQHYAQDHLRILSGLYGLLRPFDAMQPYRLEMGSRLKTRRGANLYAYWGTDIAKAIHAQADEVGAHVLVNCASQEYFGAVDAKALKLDVITPQFLEQKDGKVKMVSCFAKKARGAMARYVVQNRIKTASDLSDFDLGGYAFAAELTDDPAKPVFLRDYPI